MWFWKINHCESYFIDVWHSPQILFSKTVNGKITLKLFPEQDSINIMVNKENSSDAAKGYRCLIGDNFFDRIPKSMVPEICKEMKNPQIQTIITASMIVDPSMFPEDTNIIFLEP